MNQSHTNSKAISAGRRAWGGASASSRVLIYAGGRSKASRHSGVPAGPPIHSAVQLGSLGTALKSQVLQRFVGRAPRGPVQAGWTWENLGHHMAADETRKASRQHCRQAALHSHPN